MNPTDTDEIAPDLVMSTRAKLSFQSPAFLLHQPRSIQKRTSGIPEYVVSPEQQNSVCFQQLQVQVHWPCAASGIWTERNVLAWLENPWLVS